MIAADFNGDGKLDLAISNSVSANAPAPGTVVILLGNGDGTIGAPKSFPAGLNPLSLAAADFNGDGKTDIAVASVSPGGSPRMVSLLPGAGDGTFGAPTTYATGEDGNGVPVSILALDFNGDGAPDLAVANEFDNSISVLLSSDGKFGQDCGHMPTPFIRRLE